MNKEKQITKEECINKRKLELLLNLLVMKIAQLFSVIGVLVVYVFVWLNFTTTPVKSLIGWCLFTAIPISLWLWYSLESAITKYKKCRIRGIYKEANFKFNKKEEQ